MRVGILVALWLLGVALPVSLADEKLDRTVWAYEGGWFSTKDGKEWIEFSHDIFKDNDGEPLKFKEVKRTKEYVEIYDESRQLSVRLSATKMQWKEDGQDEWTDSMLKGRWKKTEE